LERRPHRIAGMKLAQIAHVHLGGEAGLLTLLDVVEAAADEFEGLVHRAVEEYVVIGHVEMAVVVDPARLDPHHRGDEGGEEHRFEIATVEHGATLRWAAPHRPPLDSTCESPILSPPPGAAGPARECGAPWRMQRIEDALFREFELAVADLRPGVRAAQS